MNAPNRMYLIPAVGRRVRAYHDSIRRRARPPRCYVQEDGEWLPEMAEYRRALVCGDLVEGTPPKGGKGGKGGKA